MIAQKPIYNTFVVEGKRWNCVHTNGNSANEPTPFSYFMQGDTVIGGQVCKKMFIEGLHGDKPDYYAAFYEEDGRVYRYQKESESAELIFDYVRQAGDKGTFFGQEGESFLRINFACPRPQLTEGIKRLGKALEEE